MPGREVIGRKDLDADAPVDVPESIGKGRQSSEPAMPPNRSMEIEERQDPPDPHAGCEIVLGPKGAVRGEKRENVATAGVAEQVVVDHRPLGKITLGTCHDLRLAPSGHVVQVERVRSVGHCPCSYLGGSLIWTKCRIAEFSQ